MVNIGGGGLLISYAVRKWILVRNKSSLCRNEGMFVTRLFLRFDGQGEGYAASGIHNIDSTRFCVFEEALSCSYFRIREFYIYTKVVGAVF